jgi:hypothetical protein
MPGGKAPKRKGDEAEREIVRMFPGAERTYWQPDNTGGKARGDVLNVPYLGRVEVKRRKELKTIYNWLADNGGLFMRGDKKPWLVVIPAEDLKLILEEMDELKKVGDGERAKSAQAD